MITIALDLTIVIWLVGLTVTIIGFEVSRMYLLTDKVRTVLDELNWMKLNLERVIEFEQKHERDHEDIKRELIENRHDHDRLSDRIAGIEK